MTAATAHRGADIHRIGTVRVHLADFPVPPDPPPDDEDGPPPGPADLVLTVPPHTAKDADKAAAYLAAQIKPHVLMYLPAHVGPQDYTVTVDLTHLFDAPAESGENRAATATVTEVLRGAARVRRQPACYGEVTITPVAPPPDEPPVRQRRR